MKKLYSITAAFSMMFMLAQAQQPELTAVGLFDDFSTETPPFVADPITGFALNWWGKDGQITLTPDPANKQLKVQMTQAAYAYYPFGVGFGDSNGDGSGIANTIDISGDGTFSFDIINYGTEGLQVRVLAQDVDNKQVDCILATPALTDPNQVWKYQTQVQVPAGSTVTFKAGTPNGAGGGIINNCDFTKGMWGDYSTHPPVIRYDYDLTKIKSINITVLNSAKNASDGHALALTDGNFAIANFRVGKVSFSPAGINEMSAKNNNFLINLNFESNSLEIKNNSLLNLDSNISILNSLGQIVFTSDYKIASNNSQIIDISQLVTGIYFVRIGDQMQKFIINK